MYRRGCKRVCLVVYVQCVQCVCRNVCSVSECVCVGVSKYTSTYLPILCGSMYASLF
jgi:hypothetical protein